MALRKIVATRYTWTQTDAGVVRYYTGEQGQHWDFAAGEITRGEALGALAAADGGAVAATLIGQIVTPDTVTTTAAHVADAAAATAVAPAAITSVAAAGANPTKAEYDALRADVIAVRTQVVALLADVAALRVTLNGTLAALEVAGGPMAAA